MRFRIFFLIALSLLAACTDGGEPPERGATPEPSVNYAMIPAFSLNGCTPRSPQNLERGRCDPVNLVFPATPHAEVANALIAAGWSPVGLGSPQAVLPPGATELLLQSAQLFKAQGNALTGPRFHVRLWQLPDGTTIGAAHHETGIEHDIDLDWDAAEVEVEDDLCVSGVRCTSGDVIGAQRTAQNGSERWRGFRNDARPLVIRLTAGT